MTGAGRLLGSKLIRRWPREARGTLTQSPGIALAPLPTSRHTERHGGAWHRRVRVADFICIRGARVPRYAALQGVRVPAQALAHMRRRAPVQPLIRKTLRRVSDG